MEGVGLSAGLLSLALQVADGTRKLRDGYKLTGALPSKLERLTENLSFLQHISQLLGHPNILPTFGYRVIASSLEDVVTELERLSEKVAGVESSKKLVVAARRIRLAPSCQDELKHLEELVHSAESKLSLALALFSTQRMLPPPDVSCGTGVPRTEQRSNGVSGNTGQSILAGHSVPRKSLSRRSQGCSYRKCRCRCHTEGSVGGRFWGFHYTPLSMILADCDYPRCDARQYKISFRIALSQFGLKWAVTATAGMRSGGGSYSFDISLRPQHIVRFTSDGFLLLFNILQGLVSLDAGIAGFKALYKNDPSLIDHVNPAGRGYIEELLMRPSFFVRQEVLLHLFIKDFGMKRGLDNVSLLYSCMNWIGEGPHLALFDTLFDLGYDPYFVESPRSELWPEPCDPNWLSEEITQDPFFIELMTQFVGLDHEFGGTTALQYEILSHPAKALQSLSSPMRTLETSPNFLGQTPLHLAVTQSNMVSALLEADHPVDEVDIFGLTPLMYAAGLGEIESAKLLISKGADFGIQCGRFKRDFMAYAFARGQSKFIVEIILHLQSACPQKATQIGRFYSSRILRNMVSMTYLPWVPVGYVESLVQLVGDTNFTFHDASRRGSKRKGVFENHLLHYGWRLGHVQAIMKSGFSLLNHKNSIGETALMTAASHGDHLVTRYLIEMGADVSAHDAVGMGALGHCLCSWEEAYRPFGYQNEVSFPEVAQVLLDAGADPCSTDSCDCACSSSGCAITHTLPAVFGAQEDLWTGKEDIWTTLEWLHLLGGRQNEEVLRSNLMSLLRRSFFEELRMSHTCCSLGNKRSTVRSSLFFNQSTPTDDEKVAIRAQQTQKSEQLGLRIQGIANLRTAELIRQWQQSVFQCHLRVSGMSYPSWHDDLKAWHETISSFAPQNIGTWPLEHSKPSRGYSIDEGSDSIKHPSSRLDFEPDKLLPFSSSLRYLEDLEKAFYEGRTGDDRHDGDVWYNQRLGWVLQFLEVLEVPHLYVREGLQWRLTHEACWLDGKDPSDVMKHFLDARRAMAASTM